MNQRSQTDEPEEDATMGSDTTSRDENHEAPVTATPAPVDDIEPVTSQVPTAASDEPSGTPEEPPLFGGPAAGSTEPIGHIRVTSTLPPMPAPASSPTPGPAAAGPVWYQPTYESRTSPRVVSVIWGLIVTAAGIGLLSISWGARLDTNLALIVLLGAVGLALLVGSLASMQRSRSRREGRS